MPAERAMPHPFAAVFMLAALGGVLGGGLVLQRVEAARSRLQASLRVAEVGVDPQGFWFVRIEVVNTGTLPWRDVWVSNPGLLARSSPALELGSTLPTGDIPERFDFVIETVAEGDVPESAAAITFDFAVASTRPWFLFESRFAAWPNVLSL